MKTTTTVFEIIHSELINAGHNEFKNKHNLTFYDDEYAFIQKVMNYDSDVEKIVNKTFFKNIQLENEVSDKLFKKAFVNKFFNRQIKFQTVEVFSGQVVYTLLINIDFINNLYEHLQDFVTNKSISNDDNSGVDVTDNRYLSATLPQSQVNLNVENTQLDYADENTISKTKNDTTGKRKHDSNNFNVENLIKSNGLLESVFIDFDKKCFSQIW